MSDERPIPEGTRDRIEKLIGRKISIYEWIFFQAGYELGFTQAIAESGHVAVAHLDMLADVVGTNPDTCQHRVIRKSIVEGRAHRLQCVSCGVFFARSLLLGGGEYDWDADSSVWVYRYTQGE